MSNARIEEVSDDDNDNDNMASDPEEMDVDSFDFARPQKGSLRPSMDPAASQMSPEMMQAMIQQQQTQQAGSSSSSSSSARQGMTDADRERLQKEQREKSKHYQTIYPIYFDSTRTRQQGRRVPQASATPNPLARELVDALQSLDPTLQIVFEPSKSHPKDWANPGRVRVCLKDPTSGRPTSSKVKGKHHLYNLLASYLQSHPTTSQTPQRLRLQGLPPANTEDGLPPPPAIPRGARMGTVLPLHSPALSGGGVSENFFKDVMAEMGGQMPEGLQGMADMAGMGGGGGMKKQKVKVKK